MRRGSPALMALAMLATMGAPETTSYHVNSNTPDPTPAEPKPSPYVSRGNRRAAGRAFIIRNQRRRGRR